MNPKGEKSLKQGDTYLVEYFNEICCNLCGEPIHTHFNCPICKKETPTDYLCLTDIDLQRGDEFKCDICKTKFKLIDIPEYDFMEIKRM